MKLKEIKPGMVIHCKNDDEKKLLLEEAERLGYRWDSDIAVTDWRMVKYTGMTIHFHDKNDSCDFSHITLSDMTGGVTEFSDLIIPELTAEEVIQICVDICEGTSCNECPMGDEHCFTDKYSDKSKIAEICRQWKAEHEKKAQEIEWIWKGYVVGGFDYKEADTEQEAMVWCEYYVKEHPEAKCTYKHVCRVKAVE